MALLTAFKQAYTNHAYVCMIARSIHSTNVMYASGNISFDDIVVDSKANVNVKQETRIKTSVSSPKQDTKVSHRSTADALFKECMDKIRQTRCNVDPDFDTEPSPAIEQLTAQELQITHRLFQRLDPDNEVSTRLEHKGQFIDPYWDPFAKVDELKNQVAQDFNEYARLVGAAEARKQRLQIRRQLADRYKLNNPFSKESVRQRDQAAGEAFPEPSRKHESFWDPPAERRRVLKNKGREITFRDVDALQHFVSENGQILPRRVTFATRRQQKSIFKSIMGARWLGIFPYVSRPGPADLMPLMDPLQYLLDELTERYSSRGDLRAQAMIKVMTNRYPDLDFTRYNQFEAKKAHEQAEAAQQAEEEDRGDFSRLLFRYKQAQLQKRDVYNPLSS